MEKLFKYDYDKIVWRKHFTRDQIDSVGYNSKFKLCDSYLANPESNAYLLKELLNDKTCFGYLMLKLNGAPLSLRDYQDAIINDSHRFIYFRAANQIGKSLLLDVKACINLLIDHGHGHHEAIVSKSLPQSTFQMMRVKSLLNAMPHISWDDIKGGSDSKSILSVNILDRKGKIKYTNLLICAPCTEGLLGYDLHELNLDEFEFWDVDTNHFLNQIGEPRTYQTKGNITIFSNPNGGDNFGSELEKLRLPNGKLKYHTYVFNFNDNPDNSEEDLELAMTGKSRAQIESTLLAIRSLSDKYFFSGDEIKQSLDKELCDDAAEGKQTFWFLDVGAKHDQSVLVGGFMEQDEYEKGMFHVNIFRFHVYPVGYPISRVVGSFDESQATDGWHSEKSVKEYLEEFSIIDGVLPTFGVDVTGNSGISPLFHSTGIFPIDVTFSGPKKWAMYQRLKYFLEKKLLHRVESEEFDKEMGTIISTKLGTQRYRRVGHEHENDLDDVCDSVAGLIFLMDNPDYVPASINFKPVKKKNNNYNEVKTNGKRKSKYESVRSVVDRVQGWDF